MTQRVEYDACGHEIVIQQPKEGGQVTVWIDGNAGYLDSALDNLERVPDSIVSKIEKEGAWNSKKALSSWMVENDKYFCKECNSFYDSDNLVRTHFAGHKCKSCGMEDKTCPKNPYGDTHEDICMNPERRNNTRVPTEYRCKHCGRSRQTMPTG